MSYPGRGPLARRFHLYSWDSEARMATGMTTFISPQMHRRIDQLTFPGLLAAAALMTRTDRKAAAEILMTAFVEGAAYLMTDYPPAVLPWMSFRTHNRLA